MTHSMYWQYRLVNKFTLFFMKFPIDVVYCDENGCVLEVHRHVEPWRVDKLVTRAYSAIEARSGTFLKNVMIGDVIQF